MRRRPEPELMDDAAQARAYAEADFSESNGLFVELVADHFPDLPRDARVLDLGCGPADIPLRLARSHPQWTVDAVDGSDAMLRLAREAVHAATLGDRIRLVAGRLPELHLTGKYSLILSNSLLHHLPDPLDLWHTVRRWGTAAACVLVMDLRRPDSEAGVERLVQDRVSGAPEVLVRDFRASLHAAYRVAEVQEQLRDAGLAGFRVSEVSDRHLAAWGTLA